MKFAILADIHANLEALEAVIADAQNLGATGFISVGDVIGYGPDPEAVVTRLALSHTPSVRGNHERALFWPLLLSRLSQEAQAGLAFANQQLSTGTRLWLSLLPPTLTVHGALFVHGAPPSSVLRYSNRCEEAELRKRFRGFAEPICFVGHTHSRELIRLTPDGELLRTPLFEGRHRLPENCRHICAVGSVGQPRGAAKGADYVIWEPEKNLLTVRTVPYDAEPVKAKIRAAGLPESLSERL